MGSFNILIKDFRLGTFFAEITERSKRDIVQQTMNGELKHFLTMVSVYIFLLYPTSLILSVCSHHATVNRMEITNFENDLVMHTTNVKMERLLL